MVSSRFRQIFLGQPRGSITRLADASGFTQHDLAWLRNLREHAESLKGADRGFIVAAAAPLIRERDGSIHRGQPLNLDDEVGR